jgi:ArsR family transcriptional regulator, cadmium/lead-responsive transcriptional repressor
VVENSGKRSATGDSTGVGHPPGTAGAADVGRTPIWTDGANRQSHDEMWSAIADPSRRRVLDLLVHNGDVTASWLAGRVPFSRQAVTKHLAVLERAGLVSRHRRGREVQYRVEPDRLDTAARAMVQVASDWDGRLAAIKRLAESEHAVDAEHP